jgi:hypothetical protein
MSDTQALSSVSTRPFSFLCFFLQNGRTPLHTAAFSGKSEAIQALAAAGANLEAADKVRSCSLASMRL